MGINLEIPKLRDKGNFNLHGEILLEKRLSSGPWVKLANRVVFLMCFSKLDLSLQIQIPNHRNTCQLGWAITYVYVSIYIKPMGLHSISMYFLHSELCISPLRIQERLSLRLVTP